MKKAIIVVKLVPESSSVSDSQIVKEILAEAKIPWAEKIEKVTVSRNVQNSLKEINLMFKPTLTVLEACSLPSPK
ncbi:MAG: hypothetical protein ACLFU9_03235 [Candidatus Bathyarchaeia archaeon]